MAFEDLAFTLTWRGYQTDVLAKASSFMTDQRVHIVAPPGSGKTMLGLELMRRARRPAIVLAPTVVVRDQWVARLAEAFTPDGAVPAYVSMDLAHPGLLTVATYQALYAMVDDAEPAGFVGEETVGSTATGPNAWEQPAEVADADSFRFRKHFLHDLRAMGVSTIVVDECHHLKREWWRALNTLAKQLDDPIVIALTGTPPFDASTAEWRRYKAFCGPVDAEIAVPALVAAGDLCPHQDVVWLGLPAAASQAELDAQRQRTAAFVKRLCGDATFVDLVASHPALDNPGVWAGAILSEPAYYASIAVFLNAVGRQERVAALAQMLTGWQKTTVPALDLGYCQTLLQGVLFDDAVFADSKPRAAIVQRWTELARRAGLVTRQHVDLDRTNAVASLIRRDGAALDSLGEIVACEKTSRGERMRLVVLCDAIRHEFLPSRQPDAADETADADPPEPMPLGVVPVFEHLRLQGDEALGVLSGSIVVIPATARAAFDAALAEVDGPRLATPPRLVPYPSDDRYLLTRADDASRHSLVAAMTRLFENGDIRVLVGTVSLLGEGWDAPALNCLVLATRVASYVASNQLRGRAIRTDPRDPDKVATIWHMATLVPHSDAWSADDPVVADFGPDLANLERRFGWFVGVDRADASISSGIGRTLTFPIHERMAPVDVAAAVASSNRQATADAHDLAGIRQRWQATVGGASHGRLVRMLTVKDDLDGPRSAFALDLLVAVAVCLLFGVLALSGVLGATAIVFAVLAPVLMLLFLGRSLWASRTATARRRAAAQSLLDTLLAERVFGRGGAPTLVVRRGRDGTQIGVTGVTDLDATTFIDALEELFSPVGGATYLLRMRPHVGGRMYEDYFAVPQVLSNRASADMLAQLWGVRAGHINAIYAQSDEGKDAVKDALRIKPPCFAPPVPLERRIDWE